MRIPFTLWLVIGVALLLPSPGLHAQPADVYWQEILRLERGPSIPADASPEQFQRAVREHIQRQERVTRDFIQKYPRDPRVREARLKYAAVLAAAGRIREDAALLDQANAIWNELENDPTARPSQQAAAAFSRITTGWLTIDPVAMEQERDRFLREVREFGLRFPNDERYAALLAEISLLYPDRTDIQRAILQEARVVARDPDMEARINDDLKRLAMIGRAFDRRFPELSLPAPRWEPNGQPVLILFWSPQSAPSVDLLTALRELLARRTDWNYRVIAVAVSDDMAAVQRWYAQTEFDWPLVGESGGWLAPGIRALGINMLPTLWIVDGAGVIQHVMAHRELDQALERHANAAAEKPQAATPPTAPQSSDP